MHLQRLATLKNLSMSIVAGGGTAECQPLSCFESANVHTDLNHSTIMVEGMYVQT